MQQQELCTLSHAPCLTHDRPASGNRGSCRAEPASLSILTYSASMSGTTWPAQCTWTSLQAGLPCTQQPAGVATSLAVRQYIGAAQLRNCIAAGEAETSEGESLEMQNAWLRAELASHIAREAARAAAARPSLDDSHPPPVSPSRCLCHLHNQHANGRLTGHRLTPARQASAEILSLSLVSLAASAQCEAVISTCPGTKHDIHKGASLKHVASPAWRLKSLPCAPAQSGCMQPRQVALPCPFTLCSVCRAWQLATGFSSRRCTRGCRQIPHGSGSQGGSAA